MSAIVGGSDNDMAPETSVFTWGDHKEGQLGLGGIDEEKIVTSTELAFFHKRQIKHIACGEGHTVFIMRDGTVYSCGNNDRGQLGHSKAMRKPEQIDILETLVIRHAACGLSHSIAVNSNGQLFSWGDNRHGQLGRGYQDSPQIQVPKLVRGFSQHCVVQVVCGHRHTLALTADSRLFSWGDNESGQLGLGTTTKYEDLPQHVKCLSGLPLAHIAAGGSHSFALTTSGALFGWGQNRFGQLGTGQDQDCKFPTQCKSLRSQRVKHVVCGQDHTAILTADGGVFTFGNGMHGQLGHNNTQSECLPRKVFELMGSVVTQLSCGRGHTVAYVPASGRIYSFGHGDNGQLGTGNTVNRPSPCTVKGPFIAMGGKPSLEFGAEKTTPYVVKQIYSGGDQNFVFVTALQTNVEPADMRRGEPDQCILTLDEDRLREIAMIPPNKRLQQDISETIEKLFSSEGCLNGSFLLPNEEHFGASSKNHGVNLEAAGDAFSRLAKLPNHLVAPQIASVMSRTLLPGLARSPPDVETLRLYLTLPLCHLWEESQHYTTLVCPFGRAVTQLDKMPAKVIDLWWARLPVGLFQRQVHIFKSVVVYVLQLPIPHSEDELLKRNSSISDCLMMLKKLHTVNDQNGQIIPYERFYIPELREKLDLRKEYVSWVQQQVVQRMNATAVSFCNYPFLFDGLAKTELMQVDALLQMQYAIDEVVRHNFQSLFVPNIDTVNPCLVIYVNRNNLVQETIGQLYKYKSHDFKKPLKVAFVGEEALDGGGVRKVVFIGEEAVDDGGVRKEFFLLLLREILDPKYGMFEYNEDSRLIWFNEQTFEDQTMFMLIGILCGLAIYNNTIIDINFPLALYKKLLKRPTTLEDLTELQPPVGKNLQQLLDYEEDDLEEVFCLNFLITRQAYGETKHIELIPGGAHISVNKENRKNYVDAFIDYKLNQAVHEQYKAFSDGFLRVCGSQVLELFQPRELQAMVVGNENYDWEELEKNTEYKGEYRKDHPTIKMFWEVFREMSTEDKKRFLAFLTGSDRIPIYGMQAVKIFIQSTKGGDKYLPVAHTCFNLLDLPIYQDRELLRSKLFLAIQHAQGFGLV